MGEKIEDIIADAERQILAAEAQFGPNHEAVAQRLEQCAAIMRSNKVRLLDAANMRARAQAIRTGDSRPNQPRRSDDQDRGRKQPLPSGAGSNSKAKPNAAPPGFRINVFGIPMPLSKSAASFESKANATEKTPSELKMTAEGAKQQLQVTLNKVVSEVESPLRYMLQKSNGDEVVDGRTMLGNDVCSLAIHLLLKGKHPFH